MAAVFGFIGDLAARALGRPPASAGPRSPSAAQVSGPSGSGSAGGRPSSLVGLKRLRDAAGSLASLASPEPFAGFGSPASTASSAAVAARLPAARRSGRSGPPGKVPCMCGMCPGVGSPRRPTLALVQEPRSAVRAWLRAIGKPWKPLAERYAAATAAGRKLTLRVADGHWRKWTRGAVPDRIFASIPWTFGAPRPGGIFAGGTYVSSLGRVTPAEKTANATRRLRKALASGRMDSVEEVAEEHAVDLDAAHREIDNLRAQVVSLERSLSVAEARVDADARLIVDFRGKRLPAFRFEHIKGDDALCRATYTRIVPRLVLVRLRPVGVHAAVGDEDKYHAGELVLHGGGDDSRACVGMAAEDDRQTVLLRQAVQHAAEVDGDRQAVTLRARDADEVDLEDARARSTVCGRLAGEARQDAVHAHARACKEGRA